MVGQNQHLFPCLRESFHQRRENGVPERLDRVGANPSQRHIPEQPLAFHDELVGNLKLKSNLGHAQDGLQVAALQTEFDRREVE